MRYLSKYLTYFRGGDEIPAFADAAAARIVTLRGREAGWGGGWRGAGVPVSGTAGPLPGRLRHCGLRVLRHSTPGPQAVTARSRRPRPAPPAPGRGW